MIHELARETAERIRMLVGYAPDIVTEEDKTEDDADLTALIETALAKQRDAKGSSVKCSLNGCGYVAAASCGFNFCPGCGTEWPTRFGRAAAIRDGGKP